MAQLDALACPPEWIASPLINQCCRAFLASFKIWKTATVGGNICMSLPAGPMISLTAALDGSAPSGRPTAANGKIAVADFVTGDKRNVLAPGDLLRQIDIPLAALKRRSAFRQISLTPVGRSAALLIGSLTGDGGLALTVTASTVAARSDFPLQEFQPQRSCATRSCSAFRMISITPTSTASRYGARR